jgi:hypothetical protein
VAGGLDAEEVAGAARLANDHLDRPAFVPTPTAPRKDWTRSSGETGFASAVPAQA